MNNRTRIFCVVVLIACSGNSILAQAPATVPSATQPAIQKGTEDRHAQFVAIARRGNIDLLFLGDSITAYWLTRGTPSWDRYFAPLRAQNFGIGADGTENLLFRVQNGELEGFQAKCIVLMIGTNNTSTREFPRNTPQETVAGIHLIVNEIRLRQPRARILLMGLFPRGHGPGNEHRSAIKDINAQIGKLHDGRAIFFMDIGDKFLQPDGTISPEIMPDFLHPSPKGYEMWANAIIDKVKELMAMP